MLFNAVNENDPSGSQFCALQVAITVVIAVAYVCVAIPPALAELFLQCDQVRAVQCRAGCASYVYCERRLLFSKRLMFRRCTKCKPVGSRK
jgi:hypothetical protein